MGGVAACEWVAMPRVNTRMKGDDAVMAKRSPEKVDLWTAKIIAEKPFRLATVAMANKAARSIWAMLTKKQEYRQPAF